MPTKRKAKAGSLHPWTPAKLASIARRAMDVVEPSPSDERPYVALKHIAQGAPRLLGWARACDASSPKTVFRRGDVLFGKLRPNLRKSVMAPFDGVCSTDILVLRSSPGVEAEYLLYVTQWPRFQEFAIASASGTRMPRTSWDLLGSFTLELPPPCEQRKIIAVLSSVDDIIERTQAVMDQLQTVKDAMMHDLLTHGIPGRHTRRKRTEIGEVPASWSVAPLHAVVDEERGVTYGIVQAGPEFAGGVPYIRTGDVKPDGIRWMGLPRTSPEIARRYRRSEVRAGDLVFCIRASVGAVACVPPELPCANLTQGTARIAPGPRVSGDYLLWALRSPKVQAWVARRCKGSTFREITLAALRRAPIPTPPGDEQQEIASALSSLAERIAAEERMLIALQDLKAALLSVLLTGEVRVAPDLGSSG